jgi:hypothetical protein
MIVEPARPSDEDFAITGDATSAATNAAAAKAASFFRMYRIL